MAPPHNMAPTDIIRYKNYLHGYNKNKQCMSIILDIPKPINPCKTTQQWQCAIPYLVRCICPEIKYSAAWSCFNCGEPAHETICNPMLFLPETHGVPRPLVIDQVYFICCNGGVCRQAVETEKQSMAPPGSQNTDLTTNSPRAHEMRSTQPSAAACAKCNKEKKVMKCMRCKTIRYCSKECQKEDYFRHKLICKLVTRVENDPKPSRPEESFD